MKVKPEIYKKAISHLVRRNEFNHKGLTSPFSCDCIGYASFNSEEKKKHVSLYESYFLDYESDHFEYFGWFDKSSPKKARLEREIALELMYWITKDIEKKLRDSNEEK